MSQHDHNKDKHLADFTDQVLQGRINSPTSSADADMVRLEETILRLKHTLPNNAPDSATSKQMLVRLKARMRREEQNQKIPFWKTLFDFRSNPQVGMLIAIAAVLVLAIITAPSLEPMGSSSSITTGTANDNSNFLIGGGVVTVLLLIYWIFRKR